MEKLDNDEVLEEGITDEQFNKILKMIVSIIEKCETKEEAINKIKEINR